MPIGRKIKFRFAVAHIQDWTVGEPSLKRSAPPFRCVDAACFHCQTALADRFREIYPNGFAFEGSRALLFTCDDEPSPTVLKYCVGPALAYHAKRPVDRT